MEIKNIEVFVVRLPFRFSFKHSLADRSYSDNIIVKVTGANADGRVVYGYGESVPRDYVTGETVESACRDIRTEFAPRFLGATLSSSTELIDSLKNNWKELGLDSKRKGAAWCALELALLDAQAKLDNQSVAQWLGPSRHPHGIRYGAVVPFSGMRKLNTLLWLYKMGGFQTVKLKVGTDLDSDLARIALARKILGPSVKIRVDANAAWTADETIKSAERLRAFGVTSIEQPVPADDLKGLRKITSAIPEQVVVDESLCTIEDARKLVEAKACTGFNIRLSKVGGFIAAQAIAAIAKEHEIGCHLGAQVGESGILTAAGRTFASISDSFDNYEGAANFFLLKNDLTRENLTFGPGGIGQLQPGTGFGVNVRTERLASSNVGTSVAEAVHDSKVRSSCS